MEKQKFVERSADLKSTTTIIAGGDLLGAISQVDLELYIGGTLPKIRRIYKSCKFHFLERCVFA